MQSFLIDLIIIILEFICASSNNNNNYINLLYLLMLNKMNFIIKGNRVIIFSHHITHSSKINSKGIGQPIYLYTAVSVIITYIYYGEDEN